MQSVHALPHDRESRLGEISRERGDAFVAHGAGGRVDHRDWIERRVRFEHFRAVLGVFAGGKQSAFWVLVFPFSGGVFWISLFLLFVLTTLVCVERAKGFSRERVFKTILSV